MQGLTYQLADERHIPYVAHSWMTSFKSAPCVRGMLDDDYFPKMKEHVRDLLAHSDVWVALDSQDDDLVLGYIVCNEQTLHYGYVRNDYRKEGIFKALCAKATRHEQESRGSAHRGLTEYSHRSIGWDHARGGLVFRPFFL